MDNDLVQIALLGPSKEIVKMTPIGSQRDIALQPAILYAFEKYLELGKKYMILDLERLHELPPSLIVLLCEMTARIRRNGGEFYVINVGRAGLEDLQTFNPKSFLTLQSNEDNAVFEVASRSHYELNQQRQAMLYNEFREKLVDPVPVASGIQKSYIEIPQRVDALYEACDFVVNKAQQMGFPENETSRIKIAVYEACLNAIEHARYNNISAKIRVDVEQAYPNLRVIVHDHGQGFKVEKTTDFDVEKAAMKRKTGGMGLHIIRRSMDHVDYEMDPIDGNRLIMTKRLVKE